MIDIEPDKHPDWGRLCFEHFTGQLKGQTLMRITFRKNWAEALFVRYYDSEAEINKLLEAAKNPDSGLTILTVDRFQRAPQ